MRRLTDEARIRSFMQMLGRSAPPDTRVYFTGGVSAVIMGWRASTIDVDAWFVPDSDEVLRLLPPLKERLEINVELAAPSQFVPELPGWQDRSLFIARECGASFFHYDFYSQALSKIERGHLQDLADVEKMMDAGLVEPARLRDLFETAADRLHRYPAIDPASLRRAVDRVLAGRTKQA